nr:hypothetical protein [Tanacetum cinerariifolium]
TLCKQGDWFSFAKRRAPSPVCIDDNRSCMKHWKSEFFLIDRRAIPDDMVWRHPDAAIDDPRPSTGSFNMAGVHRLSAHVIKLRDMPEGVLVLSGLSHVWKSCVCGPVLQGAGGNGTGWTGAEVQEEPHLDVRPTLQRLPFYYTPSAAVDAVILEPTPDDLAHTRSALAQSSGSTTRPSLFVGDDESDDDACVEILLVTPLHSAIVIHSSGNQGGSSSAPTTKGSYPQDSRGKGVMVDDAAAPFAGASRSRPSSEPPPSFRDVFDDAIHTVFFPFSVGPYYATYHVDGVVGILSALRKQVSGVNEKLSSFDASFAKSKAKGKETKKKIKPLTKSMDNLHFEMFLASDEFSRVQGELLSLAVSAGFEHGLNLRACYCTFIGFLQLKPEKLVRPANVPSSREVRVCPLTKESTVKPASKSLELSTNVNFIASAVASDHNEEMVNAEGIYVALDDVVELVEVGSGRVSSSPIDVVLALSAHEKDGCLDLSSTAGEEIYFLLGEGRVVCRRTLVAPSLRQTDCRCVVVHPADPELCHPP